jgi:DNA-binding phage protein
MMLRESVQQTDVTFDLSSLSGQDETEGTVPHQERLLDFAEAVVLRDSEQATALRPAMIEALGIAGFLDACGVIAGFHGFTRVADSAGVPIDERYLEEAAAVQDQTKVYRYEEA